MTEEQKEKKNLKTSLDFLVPKRLTTTTEGRKGKKKIQKNLQNKLRHKNKNFFLVTGEGQVWGWFSSLSHRGFGSTRYSGELAARAAGYGALDGSDTTELN